MIRNLFAFLICFVIAVLIGPLVIYLSTRLKAKQTILHYVKEHEQKQGTPTMGGLIFVFACSLGAVFLFQADFSYAIISLGVMIGYALLGFLDDFIKIKFKQNLGLRAYQKVIGQVGISFIIALFVYNSSLGGEIIIPFTNISIDIGFWIIPFIMFVYIALVNSVNLIDGLDGLASSVSFVILIAFGALILIYNQTLAGQFLAEQNNLVIVCFSMAGAILAYFAFNCFPAKIFMGDTGSLALGGLITSIAVFSRLTLYLPIIGIVLVITVVSDIIQVLHYKRTKRRIFKMAPLHHHFQMSGVHENRIVAIYIITTMVVSVLTIALVLLLGGFYV